MGREHANVDHQPGAEARQQVAPPSPSGAAAPRPAAHLAHRFGEYGVQPPEPATAVQPIQARTESQRAPSPEPGLDIRPSAIHGQGAFARRAYEPGSTIDLAATAQAGLDGGVKWELTRGARYTNHHDQPNARNIRQGGKLAFAATRPIAAGDEVTVSYNDVGRTLGEDKLSWKGEEIPEENTKADRFFRQR